MIYIIKLLKKLRAWIGYGYDCPKCKSENTETYIDTREQNCLDCGHEFLLSKRVQRDMLR